MVWSSLLGPNIRSLTQRPSSCNVFAGYSILFLRPVSLGCLALLIPFYISHIMALNNVKPSMILSSHITWWNINSKENSIRNVMERGDGDMRPMAPIGCRLVFVCINFFLTDQNMHNNWRRRRSSGSAETRKTKADQIDDLISGLNNSSHASDVCAVLSNVAAVL